jgi:hypothetical protein
MATPVLEIMDDSLYVIELCPEASMKVISSCAVICFCASVWRWRIADGGGYS